MQIRNRVTCPISPMLSIWTGGRSVLRHNHRDIKDLLPCFGSTSFLWWITGGISEDHFFHAHREASRKKKRTKRGRYNVYALRARPKCFYRLICREQLPLLSRTAHHFVLLLL